MAHGAPDWWGQNVVDIIAQTLASMQVDVYAQTLEHVTNRPTYGGADVGIVSVTKDVAAKYELVTITGTGMLYGGYLYLESDATSNGTIITLAADGNELWTASIVSMYLQNVTNESEHLIRLSLYDNVNYFYCLVFGHGITFESTLQLISYQAINFDTLYLGNLVYATV